MKFPKELQKKEQTPKRKNNRKYLELVKRIFRNNFIELMYRFNDIRKTNFISKKDKGKFPQFEVYSWDDYSFKVSWHKNDIEVKFNDEIIKKVYLKEQHNARYLKIYLNKFLNTSMHTHYSLNQCIADSNQILVIFY